MEAPQVALAGRSNVGKSSLVNCLAGRKALARISSTPGKTRSLNFYLVHPEQFYLVDLPGYGYARTSKTERAKWGRLIESYIRDSQHLCAVAVLLDGRLPPQKIDLELIAYLKAASIRLIPVLTKVDKCKQKDLAKRGNEWKELLGSNIPVHFSSKTGRGREKLWNRLVEAVIPNP